MSDPVVVQDAPRPALTLRELVALFACMFAIEAALALVFNAALKSALYDALAANNPDLLAGILGVPVKHAAQLEASMRDWFIQLAGLYMAILFRGVEFLFCFFAIRSMMKKGSGALGLDFTGALKGLVWGLGISAVAGVLVFAAAGTFYLAAGKNLFRMLGGGDIISKEYFILSMVPIAVLGPFFEEVIFRGMLFNGLRGAMGPWLAAIASSMVFSMAHIVATGGFSLQVAAYTMVGGLMFSYAYHKSDNIVAPYIVHASGNAALAVLPMVF